MPLSGLVTINGKPAKGVTLVFYAKEPPAAELRVPTPHAYTDESGEFSASTYVGGDGVPAGEYSVSAVLQSEQANGADPESFEAVDRLNGEYADPVTSGLSVEVPSGGISAVEFALSADG